MIMSDYFGQCTEDHCACCTNTKDCIDPYEAYFSEDEGNDR